MRKLVVVVGLALAGATAFAMWPRSNRITKENLNRIQPGMSLAEVQAILGPPGDYRTGPTRTHIWGYHPEDTNMDTDTDDPLMLRLDEMLFGRLDERLGKWESDTGVAVVKCDESGHSLVYIYYASKNVEQGPLDNLLWRVNRRWRKWFP
jgi:hypothetical protein